MAVEDACWRHFRKPFPHSDWEKQGAYFFQRVIEHGAAAAKSSRNGEPCARPASRRGRAQGTAEPSLGRDLGRRRPVRAKGHGGVARSADWRVEADPSLPREEVG